MCAEEGRTYELDIEKLGNKAELYSTYYASKFQTFITEFHRIKVSFSKL